MTSTGAYKFDCIKAFENDGFKVEKANKRGQYNIIYDDKIIMYIRFAYPKYASQPLMYAYVQSCTGMYWKVVSVDEMLAYLNEVVYTMTNY